VPVQGTAGRPPRPRQSTQPLRVVTAPEFGAMTAVPGTITPPDRGVVRNLAEPASEA
jgi:hypothetical protein